MTRVGFWRTVAAVTVACLIVRAYLRAGVDGALSITIAVGVGSLVLLLALDEPRRHEPDDPDR